VSRFSEPAWSVWENDVALSIGGSKVRASGRFSMFKGDVKTGAVMVDCKHTETGGYAVTADFWKKLSSWAVNEGREPVIAVRMDGCRDGRSEVAVVNELFYNQISSSGFDTGSKEPKRQKQKTVSDKHSGNEPTVFSVGPFRLVAYSFEAFVEDLVGYESEAI
jgi:hypothetical protein